MLHILKKFWILLQNCLDIVGLDLQNVTVKKSSVKHLAPGSLATNAVPSVSSMTHRDIKSSSNEHLSSYKVAGFGFAKLAPADASHIYLSIKSREQQAISIQNIYLRTYQLNEINLAVEKLYELALQRLAPTKRNRSSMKRRAEILWSIRRDYRELVVVPTSAMN